MKYRNGFVSNSSSTSFLVFTKTAITTRKSARHIVDTEMNIPKYLKPRITSLLYEAEELDSCTFNEGCSDCWEFFMHANMHEYPRCHKHGVPLNTCYTARKSSPYICDKCNDRFYCLTGGNDA